MSGITGSSSGGYPPDWHTECIAGFMPASTLMVLHTYVWHNGCICNGYANSNLRAAPQVSEGRFWHGACLRPKFASDYSWLGGMARMMQGGARGGAGRRKSDGTNVAPSKGPATQPAREVGMRLAYDKFILKPNSLYVLRGVLRA